MSNRVDKGFTLIELMVVVAIVAILAAIAIPSYSRYGFRARRADGREMLMRVASAQERYYTNFNAYSTSITAAAPAGLGLANTSEKGYYTITTANGASGDTQSFTLTGTPGGVQTADVCGALTIDNTGSKLPIDAAHTTNGSCW